MDKNKNRTDLLAAGRKRLQQFRQKKDSKGSKSSVKVGKSERDSDAAKSEAVLPQDPDGEVGPVHDSDASVFDSAAAYSGYDSQDTDIDIASTDPLSVALVPETGTYTTTLASSGELLPEDSGVDEGTRKFSIGKEQDFDSPAPYKVETHTIDAEGARLTSSGNLGSVISEMNSIHFSIPLPADSSTPPDLVGAKPVAIPVEVECLHGADQGQFRERIVWLQSKLIEAVG